MFGDFFLRDELYYNHNVYPSEVGGVDWFARFHLFGGCVCVFVLKNDLPKYYTDAKTYQ